MYRQLDDGSYSALRKELLEEKGSSLQQEFLEKLRGDEESNQSFCGWFREKVSSDTADGLPFRWREKFTEHQYRTPDSETEKAIYAPLKDLPPSTACRPTFWGEITLLHIEAGRIEAHYLAANDGSSSGKERIDKALQNEDTEEMDKCVRTALRRLSGLPEARGNRSVYVNCPFGRAWWRMWLCEEVSKHTKTPQKDILNILRLSQTYWEELVTLVVSRNSVLGDQKVRDVLLWCLAETQKRRSEHKVFVASNLNLLCRILGVRAAWREMGVLEQDEIKAFIDETIASLPITLKVPLTLINEDVCIDIKEAGGFIISYLNNATVVARADSIPEHLEVDMAKVPMGLPVRLSSVPLPEGVISIPLLTQKDPTVVIVLPFRFPLPSTRDTLTAMLAPPRR